MRRLFTLAACAFVGAGCHCGSKLVEEGPKLVVTQPAFRDAGGWVLDFGSVPAPGRYTGAIVVSNLGLYQGVVETAVLRRGSDPSFSMSASIPGIVPPSGSFTINVLYQPTEPGPAVGYVDLATNDPNLKTATVMLVAVSQAAQTVVCVDGLDAGWQCSGSDAGTLSIDFGTLQVGNMVSRNVQVRNQGSAPVDYLGTVIDNGSSPEFGLSPAQFFPDGGVVIAPSTNVQFAVTFAPTAAGPAQGTATVNTTDPRASLVNIQLNGQGAVSLSCDLSVSPMQVNFGMVPNTAPMDQTVAVANVGSQDCHISSLPLTGSAAFALLSPPSLPDTVPPGGMVQLDVQYTPSGTSTDTGTLTIDSDDPVHPQIAVPLSATSIVQPACVLTATPSAVTFGPLQPGQRQMQTVTLTATGSDICTVYSVSLANGDPAFTDTVSLPILVSAPDAGIGFGGPGSISVTYAPPKAGVDSDTLNVVYFAGFPGPSVTLRVPLNGTAGSPQLCISPKQLHYGNVPVGQSLDLSFQMIACGTSTVHVQSITIQPAGSPFTLPPPLPSFPETIAVGTQAGQAVRFTPTSTSPVTAQALVASDDPIFPTQTVELDTAPVTPCVVTVTPPSVNFGVVTANQPVQRQVVISNGGSGTCNLTNITLNGVAAGFSLVGAPTTLTINSGFSAPPLVVQADLPPGAPSQRIGSVTFQSNDALHPTVNIPLSAFLPSTGPYSQGWPKLYYDNNNSSRTTSDTSTVTGNVLWTFPMTPPPTSVDGGSGITLNDCPTFDVSPVVGPDGTVYQLDLFGTLHAIGPTGNQLWQNSPPFAQAVVDPFGATPFLASDGSIYLTGGSDGAGTPTMYNLSPTGTVLATAVATSAGSGMNTGDGYDVAPLLGSLGTVFAFDDFPGVILYNQNTLALLQVFPLPGGDERAALALMSDESSFWNFSGILSRLSPPSAGLSSQWQYNVSNDFGGATEVGATVSINPVTNQILVAGGWLGLTSVGTGVSAVDPVSGAEQWKRALPTHAPTSNDVDPICQLFTTDVGNSTPSVGVDGTIYIGNIDGLYALDATTGATKTGWPYATAAVTDTVSIGGDGALFFGTIDGTFYALNANGTLRFKMTAGGRISSSPAIGPDGTLYFVADDGILYAVH
jgi:hypothetical protein